MKYYIRRDIKEGHYYLVDETGDVYGTLSDGYNFFEWLSTKPLTHKEFLLAMLAIEHMRTIEADAYNHKYGE